MKTATLHRMLICGACSWLVWATPLEARFLQVDPVGYQDQLNLYAYVRNDPVNATDPSGTKVLLMGAPEDRRSYLEVGSRMTDLPLVENDDATVGVGPMTGEQRAGLNVTGQAMLAAIEGPELVPQYVVNRDPNVFSDRFDTRTVDIGDIISFENVNPDFASAVFGHQIAEYRAGSSTDFDTAHNNAGVPLEVARMGALRRELTGNLYGPGQTVRFRYFGAGPTPLHTFTFTTDANGNF